MGRDANGDGYVVSVHDGDGWRQRVRTADRDQALDIAEDLYASRRFQRVIVVERRRDAVRTVFVRRHWRFEPVAWALLPVVIASGILAFFATRWAITTFAHL